MYFSFQKEELVITRDNGEQVSIPMTISEYDKMLKKGDFKFLEQYINNNNV